MIGLSGIFVMQRSGITGCLPVSHYTSFHDACQHHVELGFDAFTAHPRFQNGLHQGRNLRLKIGRVGIAPHVL
jgi:hypothetical protein